MILLLKRISSVILFVGIFTTSGAQSITGVRFYPDTFFADQKAYVIVDAMFPSADCWIESHSFSISACNTISLSLNYCFGSLTTICGRTDTIVLGRLFPSDYVLRVKMLIPDTFDSTCTVFMQVNETDTAFTVQTVAAIEGLPAAFPETKFYPNPVKDEAVFEYANPYYRGYYDLVVYNIYFNEIFRFPLCQPKGLLKVSFSELPEGMYFYRVVGNNMETEPKQIIVVK